MVGSHNLAVRELLPVLGLALDDRHGVQLPHGPEEGRRVRGGKVPQLPPHLPAGNHDSLLREDNAIIDAVFRPLGAVRSHYRCCRGGAADLTHQQEVGRRGGTLERDRDGGAVLSVKLGRVVRRRLCNVVFVRASQQPAKAKRGTRVRRCRAQHREGGLLVRLVFWAR